MALLILCLLAVGLAMGGLPVGATKLTVYTLHKSFGITVLALAALRILWHIVSRRPAAVETLPKLDKIAAGAMHYVLYILMIAMPLTGWLMSSAAGRPVSVFGLFTLPDLVPVDKEAAHIYRERHETIGWMIILCVALHAGAALWHHVIRKNAVLRRMLPFFAAALLLLPQGALAAPSKWNVVQAKSTIAFRPKQLGEEFKGTFDVFGADVAFDPNDLKNSKAVITVPIANAHTGAPDRDENLKTAPWFDAVQFPDARFETTEFTKTGENAYTATGNVTIKGVTRPVTFPFTIAFSKTADGFDTATIDGSLTLDRSAFGIGTGQWADVSIIANDVPVDVHLYALRRASK